MKEYIRPSEIKNIRGVGIHMTWEDGHLSDYSYEYLRVSCQCAACVDEWTGESLIKRESIPKDIHPEDLFPVGNYAIQINWSDGHTTGIYSFDLLRKICPCESCMSHNR
ncbi:MAG: DUF971 domain-containing protein [Nitrospirae bacterium]|nr:DUF971 domain-containing protein [Nitrospirota bacterium]MBI3594731.1 DUF971 domain-containing protein [Nitrospirota bacterium]